MQSGNNLNEAGLVLSKKSKQLNLAHTRPNNVKKTNKVKSEVKTKKKVKDMSEPVKCEECGKIMKRSSLKKHKQRHKPKTFLCQACPKTFKESCALKNHELCHNENRERFPNKQKKKKQKICFFLWVCKVYLTVLPSQSVLKMIKSFTKLYFRHLSCFRMLRHTGRYKKRASSNPSYLKV
ncbi:PREDICTED: zinc finger protein 729-like [Rhagoletis zephyria]|uniref:zinc finger protein 729-like n=1 Tax=Rhagoletis zephyria TaxID=28612 RepID=UPI0008115D89|nr:PREDICTED: zinc finger protein 729-like [Rhagoletis zephyria]